jgi:hypothetical protein
MKIFNYLLLFNVFLFTTILMHNCNKCCDSGPSEGIPIVYYQDLKGINLFKDTALRYEIDNIKLFFFYNDTLRRVYGQTYLNGFPDSHDSLFNSNYAFFDALDNVRKVNNSNPYVTLYINLKPNVMDTLTCYWNQTKLHYDSIWYNGLYEASDIFTIVKNK